MDDAGLQARPLLLQALGLCRPGGIRRVRNQSQTVLGDLDRMSTAEMERKGKN